MDLKSFVDRAKEKAEEAVNAISAAASAPVAPVVAEIPPSDPAALAERSASAEAAEPSLVEVTAPLDAPAPVAVAPPPARGLGAIATDKLNELSAASAQKVQELVAAFQQSLPAIRSAGYEMTEFEVELGVTPKLIPHFRHAAKSIEDVDAARAMLKDNKLGMMILTALLKAGDVHRQIKVAGFGFTHIEIELGLIPCVRLQYKNDLIG